MLVVLRASGGAAVRKAGELAVKVRGVVQWMDFNDWRAANRSSVHDDTLQMDRANGDVHAHNLDLWEKAIRDPGPEPAVAAAFSETPGVTTNADVDVDADVRWMFKLQT